MDTPRSAGSDELALPPAGLASDYGTRLAIEAYLDRLNSSSPVARRDITEWGGSATPSLQIQAVLHAATPGAPGDDIFLAESQTSFGLDVRARRAAASGAPYSVGLVLAGSFRVTLADGEHVARAGEGVIIDPAAVERSQLSANSHFVEFGLPRNHLLRLGAELAPGQLAGAPDFAPVLDRQLAPRLLFMARQAADLLRTTPPSTATRVMFERWMEMIALTLLHEQRALPALQAGVAAGSGAPPRSLSRALDYIDAHAQDDILLADIAAAACISVSSLLRQFNEHVGQSPAAFLRQLRLDRARAELRQGWPGPIRELAQRWGFQSAGKFSQAYLRRFGERPRDARKA